MLDRIERARSAEGTPASYRELADAYEALLAFFESGRGTFKPSGKLGSADVLFRYEPGTWVNDVAFRPDGAALVVAGQDRKVRIVDPRNGKARAEESGTAAFLMSAAYHPAGDLFVTGGGEGTVEVRSAVERTSRGDFASLAKYIVNDTVSFASFTPCGRGIVVAGERSGLKLLSWDPSDPLLPIRLLYTHDAGPSEFSGAALVDGTVRLAAVAGETMHVYSIMTRVGVRISHAGRFSLPSGGPITASAVSPCGARVAAGDVDGTVALFPTNAAADRPHATVPGKVTGLAFDPTGHLLAAGTELGEVRVFKITNAETIELASYRARDGVTKLAFSPDGSRLAVASSSERRGLVEVLGH